MSYPSLITVCKILACHLNAKKSLGVWLAVWRKLWCRHMAEYCYLAINTLSNRKGVFHRRVIIKLYTLYDILHDRTSVFSEYLAFLPFTYVKLGLCSSSKGINIPTTYYLNPTFWLDELCLYVITVHGNELCPFWVKALPLSIIIIWLIC